MNSFVSIFSEDSRRLIIALVIVLVLLFVIIGLIGILVKKIMKWEGKKADDLIHDVVVTGVISNERKLFRFGLKKSRRVLLKQSWIPLLIIAFGSLMLLLCCLINNTWGFNPFGNEETGFRTLMYDFDWGGMIHTDESGAKWFMLKWPNLVQFPDGTYDTPHWSNLAWGSYMFVPSILVGGVWYLLAVQAYIARSYALMKLCKSVFNKSLENYDPNSAPVAPINAENPDNQPTNPPANNINQQ